MKLKPLTKEEKELVSMAVILTRKDINVSYQDYAWADNNFPDNLSPNQVIDDLFTRQ